MPITFGTTAISAPCPEWLAGTFRLNCQTPANWFIPQVYSALITSCAVACRSTFREVRGLTPLFAMVAAIVASVAVLISIACASR